ncbi:MAG: oligosaccharide flippase family protein [Candidatus Aenigmatarchaeota archaeon]
MKVILKKVKKNKTIRNSIINTTSQFLILIITTLFVAYIARKLNKTELSIFALLQIFQSVFVSFTYLGLPTTGIKLIPELEVEKKFTEISGIIKTILFLPFIIFLPFLLGMFFLKNALSMLLLKTPDYGNYMVFIGINLIFILFFDRITLLLQALQKFIILAMLNISFFLSQRILAILFFHQGHGLNGIFFGFLIGGVLSTILGLFSLKRYLFYKSCNFSIKKLISFSLPYFFEGILRFGFTQIDQVIVGVFFTPDKLAGYYIAKKIINLFILIFEAPLQVVIPKLSADKVKGEYNVKKSKVNKMYYISSLLIVFMIVFFPKYLLLLVGGRNYLNETFILNLLAVYLFFYVLFSLTSTDIFILGEPKDLFKLNLFAGIISTILTIVFAKYIGIPGIVLGQIGGLLLGNMYGIIKLKRGI